METTFAMYLREIALGLTMLVVASVACVLRLVYRRISIRKGKPLPPIFRATGILAAIAVAEAAVWIGFEDYFVTTEAGELTFYWTVGSLRNVPFHVDGGLYLSDVLCCISVQPQFLCRKCGFGYLRINSLDQLRGHVSIKAEADALAYVRLLTSHVTSWSFGPNDFYEVIARQRAGSDYIDYNKDGEVGASHSHGWTLTTLLNLRSSERIPAGSSNGHASIHTSIRQLS